jgi:TetR/AcrR family transcriptional regulator of autoinduction and epiphytic fitness
MPASPAEKAPQRSAAKKEDGRALRSASTRRAVAEAYLDLLDAGEMRPTARAIAARAGCSERAVFRHFQDMETLHSEAAVLQIQRVAREIPGPGPTSGPVAGRAAALAHRWCVLNERVSPVRRVALLHEPFSKEIARRLHWVRKMARVEIEEAFAAELAAAGPDTRPLMVAAMSAAVSWESWNEFRRRHELAPARAESAVRATLLALLASFPTD